MKVQDFTLGAFALFSVIIHESKLVFEDDTKLVLDIAVGRFECEQLRNEIA